jgi:hypothetical protein
MDLNNAKRKQLAAKWSGISTFYEQAAMWDVNAILQIENNRELFNKLRDWICATKCEPMETYASYGPRLSEGERYVIHSWAFVAETNNGGIHQYLTNSSGDYAEETRAIMHKIGATLAAEALDSARQVLFGGKPIPSDHVFREEILSEWDQKHGKNAANDFLDHYDGLLGHCESVEEAIGGYVRNHHKMFC